MDTAITAVSGYPSMIMGIRVLLGVGVSTMATHCHVGACMTSATGDHPAIRVTKKSTQILRVSMEGAVSALTISTSVPHLQSSHPRAEFQGQHANQAYYKSGIMSPEYPTS